MSVSVLLLPIIAFAFFNGVQGDRDLEYSVYCMNNVFSYKLPKDWNTADVDFNGEELILHQSLSSANKELNGFVQAWRYNIPTKEYLEASKFQLMNKIKFEFYNISEISTGGYKLYRIHYRKPQNGSYLEGYEAFYKGNDDTTYRISLFLLAKNINSKNVDLINYIIESAKLSLK